MRGTKIYSQLITPDKASLKLFFSKVSLGGNWYSLSENLNFGIVNNHKFPVPDILILKVMASLTIVESLSVDVSILNFPTAPLNP